jgi:DNA-binding transcriptional MerR regulator
MTNPLMPNMRIGQAAQASGMSTASIRFYEQQGLLGPAVRADNGYRYYSAKDIDRLRQIRTCRSLDMSLDEVQQLLNVPIDDADACKTTTQVLRQHLQHVENRITELQELQSRLMALMALCDHAPDAACPTQMAVKEPMPLAEHPDSTHLRHV